MSVIADFIIAEALYESVNSLIYRARRKGDEESVILKMLKEPYPSPEKIAWFRREYKTTKNLVDLDCVIDVYDFIEAQNRRIIVVEDFGASSLTEWRRDRHLDIEDFLELAIGTADILAEVHSRHVIHKDINPSNIVLNAKTKKLKIIDFGISTVLSHESSTFRDPENLEGTLAYLSPEQTGRMNRAIDYRTDLYSLGVTYYELLTGHLPFETSDPLELVHSHIARQPTPPDRLDVSIDASLSAIIIKLLAKNAEDRYQSARGLANDLRKYEEWRRESSSNRVFLLAQEDIHDQFRIPQKLYGREKERTKLLEAFDRVAKGATEMMLVSGYSGIGKSALVQEIHQPITRQRGYFIAGKFDQLQRDVPYAPLIKAFRGLIRQILSESKIRISAWRKRLLGALGVSGQVIVDVIPEVELISGRQPAVLELEPSEARNRFNLIFQRFISVFTQPENPLVLFVDDLQWVDRASLEFLEELMTGAEHHYLFIIGAYRDNEVDETHPLMMRLKHIRERGAVVTDVRLRPLEIDCVEQLVADTIEMDDGTPRRLVELTHSKTGGNPFFINEFLKYLNTERLIRFNYPQGRWEWNLLAIEGCSVTDNVVDLMVDKVQKLPAGTQRVLKLAACIGNTFDLNTLGTVSEKTSREVAGDLWEAMVEELILPLDDRYKLTDLDVEGLLDNMNIEYKFAHDRIQEAAYSLIAEAEKRWTHWQVGQILLKYTAAEDLDGRIFDIVRQLDYGLEYAFDMTERDELAQLHLVAGRKARGSAAYEPALHYFEAGIRLLMSPHAVRPKEEITEKVFHRCWDRQYQLCLNLFEDAAEAACLTGDFEKTQRLIDTISEHSKTLLDRVKCDKVEIQALAARNQLLKGVEAGRQALARFGIDIPDSPDMEMFTRIAAETREAWAQQDIEVLIDLPEMTDPTKLAIIEFMGRLYIPAYNAAPTFFWLMIFNQVMLTIRFGVSTGSPRGLIAYGIFLCAEGEIETGYRFGRLALDLARRLQSPDESSAIYMFNNFVRHWKESLRETTDPFLEGYRLGLEVGDLEFAGLNLAGRVVQSLWSGKDLRELSEEAAEYSRTIRRLQQDLPQETCDVHWQTILNLLGRSEDPVVMTGEAIDEMTKRRYYEETNNVCELGLIHGCKLFLNYIFGDLKNAFKHSQETEKNLEGVAGMIAVPLFYFYDSLVRLALLDDLDERREGVLERVNANQEKIQNWARHVPENFENKVTLVAAELARVSGENASARDLFDRAILLAQENNVIQDEALAHELAAQFCRQKGLAHLARHYLRDAHYAYQRWGALAKVRDLEDRFPGDLAPVTRRASARSDGRSITTTQESAGALDLHSVLKASQALSGEIDLEPLLERLLRTVIENAGAERAILILEQDGELVIQVDGTGSLDEVGTAVDEALSRVL